MIVREFITRLGFQANTDQLSKVEKSLDTIKNTLKLIAGVEIARALVDMAEKFAHVGEELKVAAESAGVSVEAFQQLAFAGKQSAVSQEEMEHSLFRLSRRLYDARMGGEEAQKAFARVGFTPEQVRGFRTSQDAMLALADRFRTISDPIQKSALAMELMGRGSLHLVGFLSQGSGAMRQQMEEAKRLGLILSGPQVEALTKLEHALQKVWDLFKAVGASISATIAPGLEYLINDFLEFYATNKKLVDVNLHDWLMKFLYALGFAYGFIKGFILNLKDLNDEFRITAGLATVGKDIIEFAKSFLKMSADVLTSNTALLVLQNTLEAISATMKAIVFLGYDLPKWLGGAAGDLAGQAVGAFDRASQGSPGGEFGLPRGAEALGGGSSTTSNTNAPTYNVNFYGAPSEGAQKIISFLKEQHGEEKRQSFRDLRNTVAQ